MKALPKSVTPLFKSVYDGSKCKTTGILLSKDLDKEKSICCSNRLKANVEYFALTDRTENDEMKRTLYIALAKDYKLAD